MCRVFRLNRHSDGEGSSERRLLCLQVVEGEDEWSPHHSMGTLPGNRVSGDHVHAPPLASFVA